MKKKIRLGVNIDHVATLRQARDETYPCLVSAARLVLDAGADQITMHLREDRRHIQDKDLLPVQKLIKEKNKLFNFEMGCAQEIVEIGIDLAPDWICLVPEKREEKTTEGGLDLLNKQNFEKVKKSIDLIRAKSSSTKISLFLESRKEVLEKAKELEVQAVEIHTGVYATDALRDREIQTHLDSFKRSHDYLRESGINVHAGHGLTDKTTKTLVQSGLFEEYNIGHWIISQSLFVGMDRVVKDLRNVLDNY